MMMTRFSWVLILFLSAPLIAQENFVSISFGISLPQGDYAGTGDLASNGYAKTSGAIKFDAGYFPSSYLGIGGSFSFGSNYAIKDSIRNDIRRHILTHIPGTGIPDDSITYATGFWNYINLFIGPHFSMRPAERVYLDFRVLGGLSILRPPDQEFIAIINGEEIRSFTSSNALSLGGVASVGMRYKLNDKLALKLEADYMSTLITKVVFDYDFRFAGDVIPPVESELTVSAVELMVGLAYAF